MYLHIWLCGLPGVTNNTWRHFCIVDRNQFCIDIQWTCVTRKELSKLSWTVFAWTIAHFAWNCSCRTYSVCGLFNVKQTRDQYMGLTFWLCAFIRGKNWNDVSGSFIYGARQHNWPLFVIAAVIWRSTPVEVSLQSWEWELSNAVDCMRVRCTVAELCMKKKRWLADRWLAVVIISQLAAVAVQWS